MAQNRETPRASSTNRTTSHGRGGAGNRHSIPAGETQPADLTTPTIKAATYTTGRGGQGNMATNTSSTTSRLAQDVEAPAAHTKEVQGTYHWGRGGQGNMTTIGRSGADAARAMSKEGKKERTASFNNNNNNNNDNNKNHNNNNKGERSGSFRVLDMGREMLGLGKKEREAVKAAAAEASVEGESAIE
ncbi:Hypothetical protein R9X50_00660000 [Acrodontium crateriforme]|uniref:Uncharacterized protein n=1 Tax=Acrodontium crateriforme TaxID=150365 RepID=A0AAQ3M856_9PEZI|nr:Hypothetical protein R9X50_00660000 [Acrodontium crateriforme]